jgi:hypothetical protein
VAIIYKFTKHYNYLQTYLQALKLLKYICTDTKDIKNAKLIKAWIKLKMLMDLALMK